MNINPKNYSEFIQLHQQLAQDYETRYFGCQALCNDLLEDTEAQKALRGMEGLCRQLKRRGRVIRSRFCGQPSKLSWL